MKHAHIIPLVGGAAIGASLALKSNPEYIASWPAFAKNDQYCKDYFKGTTFFDITKMLHLKKVDLITCVPPCAGLSTATPSGSRGCQAPQNEHMLKAAEFAMFNNTNIILIENAPTLYSKGGQEFANRFLPLMNKYGYTAILYKTSTILHGLPQNRIRSFMILFKGRMVPQLLPIKNQYTPLYEWRTYDKSQGGKWNPLEDELVLVLMKHFKVKNTSSLLKGLSLEYSNKPITGWKVFTDHKIKYKFKTKPYAYMQKTQAEGKGIMDRSPYLVWDHCNALMWKSAHKMINPASPNRGFTVRELMNLMGMPKDFKEIPQKDINVLFQNVPVTTVKTLVEELHEAFKKNRKWYVPMHQITRYNNIKQRYETF